MKAANVIDPACQPDRNRVYFGATVTLIEEDDSERIVTLVGEDEADAGSGVISWSSPIARAIRGAAVGDVRLVRLPSGERELEIGGIEYPPAP
jgi:transcription elongation factor GreB